MKRYEKSPRYLSDSFSCFFQDFWTQRHSHRSRDARLGWSMKFNSQVHAMQRFLSDLQLAGVCSTSSTCWLGSPLKFLLKVNGFDVLLPRLLNDSPSLSVDGS